MLPKFINPSKIPDLPGVYLFKDSRDKVIYCGKAINLKRRVSSYFNRRNGGRIDDLVSEIADLETIIVQSELEALILEVNLIKKFRPKYNIRLTDDKEYLYIKITREAFPRIITARKGQLKPCKQYFGPFPSSVIVKQTLKKLRRVFRWCNTPPEESQGGKLRYPKKPCFYYHLGLCSGACAGEIDQKSYRRQIGEFIRFLSGHGGKMVDELEKKMKKAAKNQLFEEANGYKKMLDGIGYLRASTNVANYLTNPNFIEDVRERGLEELMDVLGLNTIPRRIECYDISNISGKLSVGSMVVLTNGEIDKSNYRRFKIREEGKPNDFAMHREMMRRRINHNEWGWPDIIIIDGGRGQVNAAKSALDERGIQIPMWGLAKRNEWLYPPEGEVVKLKKNSLSLRLIQKIRDESHRFAITYHRNLRSKAMLTG